MQYKKIIHGIFIDRPNRFIAHVEIEGKTETVHVKNTGRCKELLIPGCKVILEDFRNRPGFENRKTKFDLIAVNKKIDKENPIHTPEGTVLINMDGQGFFPDAPTERGVKHLLELAEASKKGYKCFIAFVIQIPGVKKVFPNIETHAEFAQALETARKCGVEVLFLKCHFLENSLKILNKGIL